MYVYIYIYYPNINNSIFTKSPYLTIKTISLLSLGYIKVIEIDFFLNKPKLFCLKIHLAPFSPLTSKCCNNHLSFESVLVKLLRKDKNGTS